MKRIGLLFIIVTLGAGMTFYSCSSGTEKKAPQETTEQEVTETADPGQAAQESDDMMTRGKEIYESKCIACHQANGQGVPGAFPSLAGSQWLKDNPVLAVAQALNGSEAIAADKSVKYPAPMPPQVDTKEDAVAAVNYVMNNFGNDYGKVTMDDVKDVVINPR